MLLVESDGRVEPNVADPLKAEFLQVGSLQGQQFQLRNSRLVFRVVAVVIVRGASEFFRDEISEKERVHVLVDLLQQLPALVQGQPLKLARRVVLEEPCLLEGNAVGHDGHVFHHDVCPGPRCFFLLHRAPMGLEPFHETEGLAANVRDVQVVQRGNGLLLVVLGPVGLAGVVETGSDQCGGNGVLHPTPSNEMRPPRCHADLIEGADGNGLGLDLVGDVGVGKARV